MGLLLQQKIAGDESSRPLSSIWKSTWPGPGGAWQRRGSLGRRNCRVARHLSSRSRPELHGEQTAVAALALRELQRHHRAQMSHVRTWRKTEVPAGGGVK